VSGAALFKNIGLIDDTREEEVYIDFEECVKKFGNFGGPEH